MIFIIIVIFTIFFVLFTLCPCYINGEHFDIYYNHERKFRELVPEFAPARHNTTKSNDEANKIAGRYLLYEGRIKDANGLDEFDKIYEIQIRIETYYTPPSYYTRFQLLDNQPQATNLPYPIPEPIYAMQKNY